MIRSDPNAHARLQLALIPGLGPVTQKKLVEQFGSARAVFDRPSALAEFAGAAPAAAIAAGPDAVLFERTLAWLESPSHHLIVYEDAEYPPLLRELHDPPGVLYAIGDAEKLRRTSLAIVGARNATPAGRRIAHEMARALSAQGLCIVSGLALGVDAAAHAGGLAQAGSSVAVMGTGPDLYYPRRNRDLAERLAAEGCIATEFALGTPPLAGNFPRRNRLISGLARAVLVVEANENSGSLVTARCALDQDRGVMAVPGSIHSPLSKGCHKLIKEGARLVECANDVLEELQMPMTRPQAAPARASDRDPFLLSMGEAPVTLDQIAARSGLAASAIAARLSLLSVEGAIEELPGGRFQRVDRPA